MTGMDGGSPENGFDEISDLLKDDESTLPEDLDLRFIMSKDNSMDYIYYDSPGNDKFNFHLGEQGESELPSLSSNWGCYDISGSYTERFHSSAQNRGHSDGLLDANVVGDQKLNLEHRREQFHQDPHRLCGGYLGDSTFEIDVESVDHEILENVCVQPQGFISVENHGLEGEIIDRECTIPHTAVGEKSFLEEFEQELNQAEFSYNVEEDGVSVDHTQKLHSSSLHLDDPKSMSENGNGSRNSPDASKDVDSAHVDQQDRGKTSQVSVSPVTSGEISVSPVTSPCTYYLSDDQGLYASNDHNDDTSYSKTSPDGIYGQSDCCDQYVDTPSMHHSLHTGVQNSASSQGSGLRSQCMEGSSGKSVATTANHHRKRSRSLSPRHINRSSRCKRDCYTNREARSPRRRSSGNVTCIHLSPKIQNISDSHGNKELSYTSRSHKSKHRLGGNSDQGREVYCKDHILDSGCQKSSCQHEPQGRFPYSFSSKHVTVSPRDHHSHHNHRRMGRSISPSPVRRRDLHSGYKRERNESRSRSQYGRNRKRYSPRFLSPPRSYFSHGRSHQIRYLSPASYRRTGIGKPGTCLFVAGFGSLTTERELKRKFSRFGRVRSVRIIRDNRSGISRGYGFLSLGRDEEADAAIRAVHKTEWNGRVVLVEKSISN